MSDTRSDEETQLEVLEELTWDARIAPNEIGVIVKHGVVTLTGDVDSFYNRWAAEQAACRVRGVRAVANEIEIKLPSSSERTDEELAAASVRTLESDALLANKNIQVTVSDGWVTLQGEVEWNFQKEDAELLVRRLWGVKAVTNLVSVRRRPTPAELKEKIEKAFVRSAELDASRISVEIQGNRVILRGTVRCWAERDETERAAWAAPGVMQVENEIQVADAA